MSFKKNFAVIMAVLFALQPVFVDKTLASWDNF